MRDQGSRSWRTSSASAGTECVVIAIVDDRVLVRDSKDPVGPILEFTHAEWRAFLVGAANGEFDT
jgi:hypothetical protein